MKKHKMTLWDVGQDLIACADLLADTERDLKKAGYKDLAKMLKACRLKIGTEFNKLKSHVFGLPDETI